MTKPIHTSDDLAHEHWLARQLPQGTSLRGYTEDRAISILTRAVQDAIDDAGISRSEVARLLGTTKSYVSQVLNGSTNMTLKTLGALLWAAGRQVSDLRSQPIGAMARPVTVLAYSAIMTGNDQRVYLRSTKAPFQYGTSLPSGSETWTHH